MGMSLQYSNMACWKMYHLVRCVSHLETSIFQKIFHCQVWLPEGKDQLVKIFYPLVNVNKKLLKMAIEIVDFPIKNGGSFHSKMLVHQRVTTKVTIKKMLRSTENDCKNWNDVVLEYQAIWGWVNSYETTGKDGKTDIAKIAKPLWAHFGPTLEVVSQFASPFGFVFPAFVLNFPHSLWSSCYIHWLVLRWGRPDFRTWARCFFSWFRIRWLVSGGWDV